MFIPLSTNETEIAHGLIWQKGHHIDGQECVFRQFNTISEYEKFINAPQDTLTNEFYFVSERGRKWSKAKNPSRCKILFKEQKACYFGRYYVRDNKSCPARLTAVALPDGKVNCIYWNKHSNHNHRGENVLDI